MHNFPSSIVKHTGLVANTHAEMLPNPANHQAIPTRNGRMDSLQLPEDVLFAKCRSSCSHSPRLQGTDCRWGSVVASVGRSAIGRDVAEAWA